MSEEKKINSENYIEEAAVTENTENTEAAAIASEADCECASSDEEIEAVAAGVIASEAGCTDGCCASDGSDCADGDCASAGAESESASAGAVSEAAEAIEYESECRDSGTAESAAEESADSGTAAANGEPGLKIKAAIFDYDGTVMDSMGMWSRASSNYVLTLGKEPAPGLDSLIKHISLEEGAKIFREEYGAPGTDEEIVQAVLDTVLDKYRNTLQLKPHVLKVLDDLKAGGIPMCVATASTREMIEAGNERLGLNTYFDKIFTCVEIGANKRKPDIYHAAAEYFGTSPEETLVFEDVLHASKTAAEAGYQLVAIYDETSEEDKDEIRGLSRVYLDSYEDWPGIEEIEKILSGHNTAETCE